MQVSNMRKRFFFYPSDLLSLKPELKRVLFTTYPSTANDGFAGLCIIIGKISERLSLFFKKLKYNVIETSDLKFDEMVNLLRSNIIDNGAIFIFICINNIDGFSILLDIIGVMSRIYKNFEIPIFILCHHNFSVAALNTGFEEMKVLNFESIIISQLNDEDPIISFNNSFMQSLCDKINVFKDTDLRDVVSMCHTDYRRYGLTTYSQYSKPIYLNTSSQMSSKEGSSKLRGDGKALCFVFNTCKFAKDEQQFPASEDAGRFLQLMRSLGHNAIPKIHLSKDEIISVLEKAAKVKLNDYYAIIIYFSCTLMLDKEKGELQPSIVLKNGEYLLLEDIMQLSRKFPLQPTILIVNSFYSDAERMEGVRNYPRREFPKYTPDYFLRLVKSNLA
ncbi:hypothetical protein B4U80_14174, partial [Leptotrombidium deliense]